MKEVKQKAHELRYILSVTAYYKYIDTVKGNKYTTYEQANRKINRNIILAGPRIRKKDKNIELNYGRLTIVIDSSTDFVVDIKNFSCMPEGWIKDMQNCNKLNKKFGIEV